MICMPRQATDPIGTDLWSPENGVQSQSKPSGRGVRSLVRSWESVQYNLHAQILKLKRKLQTETKTQTPNRSIESGVWFKSRDLWGRRVSVCQLIAAQTEQNRNAANCCNFLAGPNNPAEVVKDVSTTAELLSD